MNTYVPVRKIIKAVSTQRCPKCLESVKEKRRRRWRWKPWLVLICLSGALVYFTITKQVLDNTHHENTEKLPSDNYYENLQTTSTDALSYNVNITTESTTKFPLNLTSVNISQENSYPNVLKGGSYHPPDCRNRFRVGIIVPYRNREENLGIFLNNIHPFLIRQKLDYQIFVIEQHGNGPFNKGRLYNAGYKEMIKFNKFFCIIFHDLDLLPLDDNIMYNCPTLPRHMCAYVNDTDIRRDYNITYSYKSLFGGVVSMTIDQFVRANGFSNLYFGWGAEDNDMFWRLHAAGYPVVRYQKSVGMYLVLPHKREPANPFR
ncbi:hypothetical protein HW555_000407 [Spodoptera exigua]|uniref:Beta-1,4-N-acetylgalactosaminyltransferase n=1 Tax=Spodoptera exigua TaxID=7107 RepID=A0A835GU54_SPOEX|nr:hypothetical protein HW555_000407 [Spodoptera exigua]